MKCILIASAGTGGHIYPALALAEALKKRDSDTRIVFVRSGRKRFDDSGFGDFTETFRVPGVGMPRKLSPRLLVFVFQTLRSLYRSLGIIKKCRPDVVVGFGNFGSYGLVRAAGWKRIPVFLHEGNSIPGKANRALAKYAHRIGLNFPDADEFFPGKETEIVGMPLREEFNGPGQREKALDYFGLESGRHTLLVMGGSQGARHINQVVCEMLQKLRQTEVQVVHFTGRDDYEEVISAYSASGIKHCVKPFEKRMRFAYDAAHVMISRAGASSIAEILAMKKPAVLVPFPFATDNHQFYNAKYLYDRNAAMMIEDKNMTVDILFEKIEILINNKEKREELSRNCAELAVTGSADRMAETVLGMTGKQGK